MVLKNLTLDQHFSEVFESTDKANIRPQYGKATGIKCLNNWVQEATEAHGFWHKEAWTNWRFKDGDQWSAEDKKELADAKEINPITINKIISIIEDLKGEYIARQQYIQAKGRTQDDAEISQLMTESIAYVLDQCGFYNFGHLVFDDQITAGYAPVYCGYQPDPRNEKIIARRRPWYTVFYDPFGDPWLNPQESRYVFYRDWKNTEDIKAAYPNKSYEINELAEQDAGYDSSVDISQDREDFIKENGWFSHDGKRCRPVEMYFAVNQQGMFAILPDGTAEEIDADENPERAYFLVTNSVKITQATVKKVRKAVFLGNIMLEEDKKPFGHDLYPYAQHVGYLDAFGFPYGVPQHIREQNMEVNKKRSMALALLGAKRTFYEENSVENENELFEEVQRINPFIRLNQNATGTVVVEDNGGGLAAEQLELMRDAEREIREISGRNSEQQGGGGANQSRVAFEAKVGQSSQQTATLFQNEKIGRLQVGKLISSLIQTTDTWTNERVLRVTDRVSSAETFHTLNESIVGENGEITVRNNLAQGKFDFVISDAPVNDTIREKNVELIMAAINKAPPEAVGPLLMIGMDLANLPNKDSWLPHIATAMGTDMVDYGLTRSEREEKLLAKNNALAQKEELDAQLEYQERTAAIQKEQASVVESQQEARLDAAKAETERIKARGAAYNNELKTYQEGYKIQKELERQRGIRRVPDNE